MVHKREADAGGRPGKKEGFRLSEWKLRRAVMALCWCALALSLVFNIYKNFSGGDAVTVVEKETVVERVENHPGLEAFVSNFAYTYFSYPADPEGQADKAAQLKRYMQGSLVDVNIGLRDVADAVTVSGVQIWSVAALSDAEGNKDFSVSFSLTQKNSTTSQYGMYRVDVHAEGDSYVVIKNPVPVGGWRKSGFEKPWPVSDDGLPSEQVESIRAFLIMFFGIYPQASGAELAYYVKDASVQPIGRSYTLLSLEQLSVQAMEDGAYQAYCYVVYSDERMRLQVLNEYDLILTVRDTGEWIITKMR